MIGYVTLGTNDLKRAAAFYDALLAEIGAKRMMENDEFVAWSVKPDLPGLGVTKPFDKKTATVGNGVMVALEVDSEAKSTRCIVKRCNWEARTKALLESARRTSTRGIFETWMATSSMSSSAVRSCFDN